MKENKEYKQEALNYTHEYKGKLAFIYFLYSVIIGGISSIGTMVISNSNNQIQYINYIGTILTVILVGPFAVSLVKICIDLFNKKEPEVKTLFDGFKNFDKALSVGVLYDIFLTLWTLLFIIPGIVMSLAYSMTFYIHVDHPELKPLECIKKSKNMMKGYKTKLFGLYLKYFGEYLLSLITLGIYGYWLSPKVNMATYLFYLDLKKENGEYNQVIDSME